MIDILITEACNMLHIQCPAISKKDTLFTDTMLAAYIPEDDALHIKASYENKLDLCFSVLHELRHKWQYCTDRDKYFGDYKLSGECSSAEEYNLQLAEVDANAFSKILMLHLFGVTPLFNGCSDAVKARIDQRCKHIAKSFTL